MNAAELARRLATLIPNPTCATKTLGGTKLPADIAGAEPLERILARVNLDG